MSLLYNSDEERVRHVGWTTGVPLTVGAEDRQRPVAARRAGERPSCRSARVVYITTPRARRQQKQIPDRRRVISFPCSETPQIISLRRRIVPSVFVSASFNHDRITMLCVHDLYLCMPRFWSLSFSICQLKFSIGHVTGWIVSCASRSQHLAHSFPHDDKVIFETHSDDAWECCFFRLFLGTGDGSGYKNELFCAFLWQKETAIWKFEGQYCKGFCGFVPLHWALG